MNPLNNMPPSCSYPSEPPVYSNRDSNEPSLAPENSAEATRVDQWLDRTLHPQLPHTTIFDTCAKLSAKENWNSLVHALNRPEALDLVNGKAGPNNHIRLLWIIQDNLQTLIESPVETLFGATLLKIHDCFNQNFLGSPLKPQFAPIEKLAHLIHIVKQEKNPSNNLKMIQEKSVMWTKVIDMMCKPIAPHIVSSKNAALFPRSSDLAISRLTSYLFENKKNLKITLEGKELFLTGLSPSECSLFTAREVAIFKQLLDDSPNICCTQELPYECQTEIEAQSGDLKKQLDHLLSLEKVPAELSIENLDPKLVAITSKIPPEAYTEIMNFTKENLSPWELTTKCLAILEQYLTPDEIAFWQEQATEFFTNQA